MSLVQLRAASNEIKPLDCKKLEVDATGATDAQARQPKLPAAQNPPAVEPTKNNETLLRNN